MKINYLLVLISGSVLTMSNGCEKQNDVIPCEKQPIDAQATFSLACSLNAQTGQSQTFIINSSAELKKFTLCGNNSFPVVDFAQYTLLAGRAAMPAGAILKSQVVTKDCQGNYEYSVDIVDAPQQTPTDVDYSIVIPKLGRDIKVNFVVNRVK